MLGTIVNTIVVVIGSLLGVFFRSRLSRRYNKAVTQGLGLCVIVIGLQTAMGSSNTIITLVSIALGTIMGTWLDIEGKLSRMGDVLQSRFARNDENGNFAKGFVSASLLFCVGAMAIVGSMESGLRGDHATLYAKSVLDFASSIFLAGMYGIGVIMSAVTVFVYQGTITLLARVIAPILTDAAIAEMSAVGGVLIIGIGLNTIRKEHIPVGNMLPAVLLPLLLVWVF